MVQSGCRVPARRDAQGWRVGRRRLSGAVALLTSTCNLKLPFCVQRRETAQPSDATFLDIWHPPARGVMQTLTTMPPHFTTLQSRWEGLRGHASRRGGTSTRHAPVWARGSLPATAEDAGGCRPRAAACPAGRRRGRGGACGTAKTARHAGGSMVVLVVVVVVAQASVVAAGAGGGLRCGCCRRHASGCVGTSTATMTSDE